MTFDEAVLKQIKYGPLHLDVVRLRWGKRKVSAALQRLRRAGKAKYVRLPGYGAMSKYSCWITIEPRDKTKE